MLPAWDGSDRWPVSSDAILWGSSGPPSSPQCYSEAEITEYAKFVDANAYVSGGVLVASLSGTRFVAATEDWSLPIQLGEGFLVGRLERVGGRWRIEDGMLAGRLATEALFDSVSLASLGGQPICKGELSYNVIRNQLCSLVDLPSGFGGPSAPCDALSYGIAFSAFEAQLSGVLPTEELVSLCPPGSDPSTDRCD